MCGPVLFSGPRDIPSPDLPSESCTADQKIQQLVEHAVKRCGSAAALARALDVRPPTVCQWRSGRKKPDATKLIRIQEIAQQKVAMHQLFY